jgi:cobalt/nickel transport protein
VKRSTWFVLGGLLVALLLAGFVSNFASRSPDGLDSASRRGCTVNEGDEITGGDCMGANAEDHELSDSPFADYGLSGIGNSYVSTAVAGVTGVLLTFAVAGGVFWLVRRRRSGAADEHDRVADEHDRVAAGED